MIDSFAKEVFYSCTNDLNDIPDTFFSSYEDALESAVKNHKKYILRATQFYELMVELENLNDDQTS